MRHKRDDKFIIETPGITLLFAKNVELKEKTNLPRRRIRCDSTMKRSART